MHEQYPNKRIIAHFMQPHAPYIGPTGLELTDRLGDFGVFHPHLQKYDIPDLGIAAAMQSGEIDDQDLRQAYDENLNIVLEHAESLTDRLGGKSVITVDHGELLGERVVVGRLLTPDTYREFSIGLARCLK
jgi:hypothetical protein